MQGWLDSPGTNYGLMLWGSSAFTKYIGWDFYTWSDGLQHPSYRIAWTTVPKVEPVAPMSDTVVDGQPTIVWNYDDDKHRLADLNGDLISKPQQKVEIQFSSKPDSSGLLDTVPVDDLKDYDHTVTTNEYGFANNTRYFWRMRAAGLSDWPNAGDVTWSSWTDWNGFTTGDAQAASDGRGVEAARASEPIGAGASVEASSGALVIARQDLAGPARGGSLSYGATYRSDHAGSAELPTGWRSPVSTITRNDNRAPTPGFDSLSGWSTGGDTTKVGITSVTGGRTGNRLRFYTTTADCTAYVKSHPDGTGAYPVWPGQRVEAGAWMLASGLSLEADTGSPAVYGGVVKIHFWKADGTYVGEARSGNFAEYNSGSWQHVGTAATVPADAYFARVNIEYQNAKGTLYVDDAYFGDGAVDLADADGTTHHMRQVKDGTFTRDPLAQGAGLAYKNLAKGAPVSAGTLTSVNDAPDPGFDKSWATGGWYTNSTSVATQQTTVKRTGTGALKFYSASNTSVYVSPCSGTTATMFPIGGVRHLHSSMWLNTDSLAVDTTKSEYGVFFKYHFYDSAGNFISTVQPSSYSNTADTNGWREVFMDGAVPTNASFVKFNIEYRYASGTAYVDDVEMGYGALVNQRATDGLTTSSSLGYDAIPIDSGRYLQIDLGSVQAFSQLRLGLWDFQVSDCAYAAGPTYTYKVVAAANTADFGTSGEKQVVPESGTSVSGREWKDHSFAPVEARYIRIYPTAVSYGNEFRVTEVEVPRYELGHTPILLDSAGRIAATCDLSGNLIKQTFDTSSRLSTITDETGRSIGLTYVNGELSQLSWTGKDSAGTQVSESKRVSYSGAGSANTTLTVSADDSTAADGTHLRTVVSYHYDSAGRIDRITDADGVAICIAYVSGKVGSVTYADGSTKTFTYTHVAGEDSVTVTTAGGTEQLVSKTVYEAGTGRALSAVVDPNGLNLSSTVSYDCYGGVRSTDDPMDHTTTTVRDGHGNVVRTSDEQSRKTSAVYDDDLLAESRDVKGNLAQSEYDAARRLLCSASAISEAAADEDGGESAVTSVYDEFGNKTMGSIPGSTAENLLLDPCFANNVTGSGFGWDGAAASAISVLGTEAYQGAYYINLHADAAQSYYTSDQVAVSPERTYMVSAWVRGEGQVCIKEYDKDGAFIRTRTPVIFTGSTSGAMTRVSGVYWPDSNVAKVAVQLWADTGDTAEIDNVRFEMATRIGADNLLDNASFETTSGLQPVTWTPRGTGNATMKAVYDMAVSGAKSAYIKTTGAASTNDGYFYSGWTRVRPGERYTVSGSIKTKNIASTGAAHINVLYYSSYLGTQTNRLDIGSSTGTTDWTRKAANIVVPPSGTSFMRVSIETTGAAGEAWFDTIAIEPVRGIETYGYDNGTDTFQTRSDSITEHT
ncbi:MAG: carbohydrate binding domain-containing protein, partial [Actinomycetota bacterium]|nr:carbohydrate binding domain-containing protein [Actinomycetota bacterium]